MNPDETTMVSVLSSRQEITRDHVIMACYLVVLLYALHPTDMYAKCGSVEEALVIFPNMPEKNLVSWEYIGEWDKTRCNYFLCLVFSACWHVVSLILIDSVLVKRVKFMKC